MTARSITLFVATARSATQWIAKTLGDSYPDLLTVRHEPIRYDYDPKHFLRAPERLEELRNRPPVAAHLQWVRECVERSSYVETGFPAYAAAPLFLREFGERVRLVHLTRDPLRVAASLVTHNWYVAARDDDLHDLIVPEPFDPGVVQKDYAPRWENLSPFEKALFYWTEVHLYGLELPAMYPATPYLRVRAEDLFSDPACLRALTGFLGVPYRDQVQNATGRVVDSYHWRTSTELCFDEALRHPRMRAVAEQLGYQIDIEQAGAMRGRYVRTASLLRRFLQVFFRKLT